MKIIFLILSLSLMWGCNSSVKCQSTYIDKAISYQDSARILLQNGEYNTAVEKLLDAEESALSVDDQNRLGLIYRELTYLFNIVEDMEKEVSYSHKEYDAFYQTGDSTLIKFALLDYARAEIRLNRNLERGIAALDSLLNSCTSESEIDLFLKLEGLRVKMTLGHFRRKVEVDVFKDVRDTYTHFMEYFPDDFFKPDTPNGKVDYYGMMPFTPGASFMVIAEPYASEIHRQLDLKGLNQYYREREVVGVEFRYPDYLRFKEKENDYDPKTVESYIHKRLMEKAESEQMQIIIIFIAIAIIVVAYIIIREFQTRTARRKLITEAADLRELLRLRDGSTDELKNHLNEIYSEKFNLLEELCDMYILPSKHTSEQKRIYDTVTSIIDSFKMNGERLADISSYVDRYKNNIVTHFRTEFPDLPEIDYALFIYLAAGFSRQATAFLMDESLSVVSNRKYRIKKRIQASSSPLKQQYLSALK